MTAYWPLQAYRELDDALLHLRVNEPEIGLVCLRTEGDVDNVLAVDQTLAANRDHWLIREITAAHGARAAPSRSHREELLCDRRTGKLFRRKFARTAARFGSQLHAERSGRTVELALSRVECRRACR